MARFVAFIVWPVIIAAGIGYGTYSLYSHVAAEVTTALTQSR